MRPASEIANQICGCSNRDQHQRDIALIEADRKQVREEVVREVCEWIRVQDEFSDLACRLAANCEAPDVDLSWTLPFVADEIERKYLGEKA